MRALLNTLIFICLTGNAWANCAAPNLFPALPNEERAALTAAAAEVPFAEGLLWQVERDGVISHIIGTFHVHLPEHAAMVDRLQQLEPAPETVFLELTTEDQLGFQQHLLEHPDLYLIQSGPSLIDRLGPDLWAQVAGQLKDRGMPAFLAARYQPWFLGMTLMLPPCAYETVKSGQKGLDLQIADMAEAADIPMQSLDTIDGLITILASDPLETQLEDLRWGLSLGDDLSSPEMMGTVIALYLQEKVQLIWELNAAEMAKNTLGDADATRLAALLQEAEDELIVARNTAWADVLTAALSESQALVAVGALHLPGEMGVLAQLQRAGFAVRRVSLWPG